MDCPHCEGHGELEFQRLEERTVAAGASNPHGAFNAAYELCPRCEGSGVLELEEGGLGR